MPKTLIAQSVQSVNPLRFESTSGVITGLIVNCEVNYGELGMTHQLDIWEDLTPAQKAKAQTIYDLVKSKVETIFLG